MAALVAAAAVGPPLVAAVQITALQVVVV